MFSTTPSGRPRHRLRLRIAATWPWATQTTAAITRLHAVAPRLTSTKPPLRPGKDNPWARRTPPTRCDSRAASHGQTLKDRASWTRPPRRVGGRPALDLTGTVMYRHRDAPIELLVRQAGLVAGEARPGTAFGYKG
jgi:hypothetical protein